MYQITDFTKRCVYDCYVLMKKCVDFEHIEDSEFVLSTFKQIGQYKIALPPELNKHIEQFLEKTLHPEYYGAAEPPVRCGESHLSGLTEPPQFVY